MAIAGVHRAFGAVPIPDVDAFLVHRVREDAASTGIEVGFGLVEPIEAWPPTPRLAYCVLVAEAGGSFEACA